jgi:hypothetical protein
MIIGNELIKHLLKHRKHIQMEEFIDQDDNGDDVPRIDLVCLECEEILVVFREDLLNEDQSEYIKEEPNEEDEDYNVDDNEHVHSESCEHAL